MICQACNTENEADDRFCHNCGGHLDQSLTAAGSEAALADRKGGERRHLVVLFSDIVSSTEIASGMDPEEWHEFLADYHAVVTKAVARFGGHVAKYLGDGVLAYFGWPTMHESDAERAALAGCAILDDIAALNRASAERKRPTIGTRIGLHVGEVVIASSGDVYGDAPNVAARVQVLAAPDTVVATELLHRSISDRLVLQDLGEHRLRGFGEPTRLYRVLSPQRRPPRSRSRTPATPLIGRSVELRAMFDAWEKVRSGSGRVVTVTGEAGIGKSRLVQEFRARLSGTPHAWLATGGSDIFRSTPFHPVVGLLNGLTSARHLDRPDIRRRRLTRLIEGAGLDASTSLPFVAELLGMGGPDATDTKPADRRAELLKILANLTMESARHRPTVLVIEDLHWVDPSTLEILEALTELDITVPLLIVMTARPEFRAPWPVLSHHSHIVLGRLGRGDIREIVKGAASTSLMLEHLLHSIAERASGIPLFAEELAHLVAERGANGDTRGIPNTLAASLTARLDQLGSSREIAQTAAVIGEEFDPALLAEVAELAPDALSPLLDQLTRMDILARRLTTTGQAYAFRHSLLRDAAYETLLRSRRRQLHERVAEAIGSHFPAMAQTHPEVLAHHLSLGGKHGRAVEAWRQAATAANERGAYREAEQACERALAEVEHLAESRQRDETHLDVLQALVGVLQVTHGYSAPRTNDATERARAQSARIGAAERSIAQLAAKWAALMSAGKLGEASAYADQYLELAQRDGRAQSLAGAHMIQMTSHYRRGKLVEAERHFVAGQPFFVEDTFRRLPPGAVAQTYGNASRLSWMLGQPDEARRRMAYMMKVAEANNSPYDVAFAQYMAAILGVLIRDEALARRMAENSIELSDRNGFPQFAAISRIALGRALVDTDRSSEAVSLIQRGIAGMTETGSRVAMTLYQGWLAEAQAAAGDAHTAQAAIERAFEVNPEELFFRPELLRIRGELLCSIGDASRGEADIRAAIAAATDMAALSMQLRAAMALHRWLGRNGNDEGARIVAATYRNFTEGFDTPDLSDAAALTKLPDRP